MAVRMSKPWQRLTPEAVSGVAGHMGVYQLANEAGTVAFIGYAGARSLHGLHGELATWLATAKHLDTWPMFRIEVTTAYLTRWQELLMAHHADHGAYPPINVQRGVPRLGRLSPA